MCQLPICVFLNQNPIPSMGALTCKEKKKEENNLLKSLIVPVITSEPSSGCLNFHERKPILLHDIWFQEYHDRKVAGDF